MAVVAAALVLALAAPAGAGRPLETEDTDVLDPGRYEIELGGDYARESDGRVWLARGVLSAGLLPRLEGRVEIPLAVVDPEGAPAVAGVADALVGAKYRFLDEADHGLAVMAAVGVRLPVGDADRGLGRPGVDVTALAAASRTLGPATVTANVAHTFATADGDPDFWILALAAEHRLTPAVSLVAEVLGVLAGSRRLSDTGRARVGATWEVREGVTLDAAIGHGFGRDSANLLATVGVTLGF